MPTDEELNQAMHGALGYDTHMWPHWIDIPGESPTRLQRPKSFLTDRNTLPGVWQAIKARSQWACYLNYLRDLDPRNAERGLTQTGHKWNAVTAPCRVHVEAALRCLGAWREEEWGDGTE